MDKELFESFMRKHGDRQKDLADMLGVSLSCINAKINGRYDFWQTEIAMIKDRYRLSSSEVDAVFFSHKVS